MEIGIFNTAGSVDALVAEVRKVHDEGFSYFFTPQIFGLDAMTSLAVAAREVPGITLATDVVPIFRQHPMTLAQQALTISGINDGNLLLGVGLSHQIVVEGMWGLSYEKPLRSMREYLDVLMPLLRGEPVDFQGETVTARGALDVKAPVPEVVVAALGPKMLQLAGTVADGTATWMVGPETLRSHIVPTIGEAASAAGRQAPKVVVSLPVCVTEDPGAARDRAAQEFSMYGFLPSYRAMLDREGAAGPEDVAIIGTAAEVSDRLSELSSIGTSVFVGVEFGPRADREATREFLVSQL